jgi:hypothetical protein
MAIIIKENFNNGIESCYLIDSDKNKQIIDKTTQELFNYPVYIVARRYNDYDESEFDKINEE